MYGFGDEQGECSWRLVVVAAASVVIAAAVEMNRFGEERRETTGVRDLR